MNADESVADRPRSSAAHNGKVVLIYRYLKTYARYLIRRLTRMHSQSADDEKYHQEFIKFFKVKAKTGLLNAKQLLEDKRFV